MSYLSLEEAAAKLGISSDQLVEFRSQGLVRGFRDGSSWKFAEADLDRLADEIAENGVGGDDDLDLQLAGLDSEPLKEIDSAELSLDDPALFGSDESVDLAIDPKEGSTGPVAKAEVANEMDSLNSANDDDLGLADADSDDLMIGDDSESLDLASFTDDAGSAPGASSLELMKQLDSEQTDPPVKGSSGEDVLSELDLLGEEQAAGSGLITGDSKSLLSSSGMDSLGAASPNMNDDALADDDDLVIADDDAEIMLDSVGDISVAGDSGINLMSPSDSGLSLESEPLDLAGSSLSALDLGAELADGSNVSKGSSIKGMDDGGSAADEEFQLSPSEMNFDMEDDSSQIIEVEDSEIVDVEDAFGDADFGGDFGGAGIAAAGVAAGAGMADFGQPQEATTDAFAAEPVQEQPQEGFATDSFGDGSGPVAEPASVGAPASLEVPFSTWEVCGLLLTLIPLCLCGMLMTDLLRNMWMYEGSSQPVNQLTQALIDLMNWNQ